MVKLVSSPGAIVVKIVLWCDPIGRIVKDRTGSGITLDSDISTILANVAVRVTSRYTHFYRSVVGSSCPHRTCLVTIKDLALSCGIHIK